MKRIMYRAGEDVNVDQLALRYGASAENIKRFNDVGNVLHRGERVIIDCREGSYYVVQPFDDMAKIAKKFGVDIKRLEEVNGLDKVFIGQKIFVPVEK